MCAVELPSRAGAAAEHSRSKDLPWDGLKSFVPTQDWGFLVRKPLLSLRRAEHSLAPCTELLCQPRADCCHEEPNTWQTAENNINIKKAFMVLIKVWGEKTA